MSKPIIYFLCTGNSCRSQMAEGFAKHYLTEEFELYSAGVETHGIHSEAIRVMAEKGIDISNQFSSNLLMLSLYAVMPTIIAQ